MSHDMVMNVKNEIDSNNKSCKPRIVGRKCRRCNKIHGLVSYRWHNDHVGNPSVTINFQGLPKPDLEKVFEAEKILNSIGIHFDTGYGCYGRDWSFDWSLTGEHHIKDERAKRYVLLNRRPWANRKEVKQE